MTRSVSLFRDTWKVGPEECVNLRLFLRKGEREYVTIVNILEPLKPQCGHGVPGRCFCSAGSLERGLRICSSNKPLGDADTAGLWTTETHPSQPVHHWELWFPEDEEESGLFAIHFVSPWTQSFINICSSLWLTSLAEYLACNYQTLFNQRHLRIDVHLKSGVFRTLTPSKNCYVPSHFLSFWNILKDTVGVIPTKNWALTKDNRVDGWSLKGLFPLSRPRLFWKCLLLEGKLT